MDDVILLPLKLGIYAVMALFALGASWTLRTRRPLPATYRLPHEFSITNLIGLPALFWGLGVMASLARPHALVGKVHMEAVLTLCVMALSMFGLVAVVVTQRFAMRSFAIYHTLIWGGLISGITLATSHLTYIPRIAAFSACSLCVCGTFAYVLTHTRARSLPA